MQDDRPYTVSSLAAKWRCSPKQVYELVRSGQLAAFMIGRKRGIRISAQEVSTWENQRTSGSTATVSDGAVKRPSSSIVTKAVVSVRG